MMWRESVPLNSYQAHQPEHIKAMRYGAAAGAIGFPVIAYKTYSADKQVVLTPTSELVGFGFVTIIAGCWLGMCFIAPLFLHLRGGFRVRQQLPSTAVRGIDRARSQWGHKQAINQTTNQIANL